MSTATPRPVRRFSVDDVVRMVEAGILGEDERVELIDGELIVMAPQGPEHADITTRLHDRLRQAFGDGFVVREAKPIVTAVDGLPEPDLAVVAGSYADFARRHPRGDEAVLVVEVAVSSLLVDRAKAATYARAGVPRFWLLDVKAGRIEAHEEPHADGRYGIVRVLADGDVLELRSGALVPVRELF